MAEVFLAVHTGLGGFEKLVVIKRILPHLEDEGQFVQMFLDEARLAAKLHHAGIVSIVDLQRDEDNVFSVVMEYLRGESLGLLAKLQRKRVFRVPPVITAYLVAQVADALHFAHTSVDSHGNELSLIHRDVTPSNVIVTYDGETKLIDFGIAKANDHLAYTRPGTVKGKFSYGSPEQLSGKDLDARSDVFSLGVVFHELLTGERLFEGANPADSIRAVISREIPKPSSVARDVPAELDPIVLKALHRERDKRYASAAEFRDAIHQALEGRPTRRADVASWMKTHMAKYLARRQAMEKKALSQARSGQAPDSGMLELGNFSSSGMTSAPKSAVRPSGTVAQFGSALPRQNHNRLPYILLGLVVVVLLILTFLIGRSLAGSETTSRLEPMVVAR